MKVAPATFMLNVYEASASHVLMTNHEVIYIVNVDDTYAFRRSFAESDCHFHANI